MTPDQRAEALEAEDAWDLGKQVPHKKASAGRAIVSVAFAPQDLAVVLEAAEVAGKRLSTFVREAALARARYMTSSIISASTQVSDASAWSSPPAQTGAILQSTP